MRILALDVTEPASVKAAAANLEGQAIDVLLNNAGVGGARGQTIGNIDYEAWRRCSASTPWVLVSEAFVDHVARSKAQAYYFWRLDRISQLKGCREHGCA